MRLEPGKAIEAKQPRGLQGMQARPLDDDAQFYRTGSQRLSGENNVRCKHDASTAEPLLVSQRTLPTRCPRGKRKDARDRVGIS